MIPEFGALLGSNWAAEEIGDTRKPALSGPVSRNWLFCRLFQTRQFLFEFNAFPLPPGRGDVILDQNRREHYKSGQQDRHSPDHRTVPHEQQRTRENPVKEAIPVNPHLAAEFPALEASQLFR